MNVDAVNLLAGGVFLLYVVDCIMSKICSYDLLLVEIAKDFLSYPAKPLVLSTLQRRPMHCGIVFVHLVFSLVPIGNLASDGCPACEQRGGPPVWLGGLRLSYPRPGHHCQNRGFDWKGRCSQNSFSGISPVQPCSVFCTVDIGD